MVITSLGITDEAVRLTVFNRFKTIMGLTVMNTDTMLFPKDIAQRIVSEKRAKTNLEFINVWRTSTKRDLSRERMPLARPGLGLRYTDSNQTDVQMVKSVPADLAYSAWFWSKDKDKLNAVTEKFLFWKFDHPTISITYDTLQLDLGMWFKDIADESPIEMMFDKGLYFVLRTDFIVQAQALVTSETLKTVKKIFVKLYDDVDPGGPHERDVLLYEETIE